jgi:hypothetical protein
MIFSFSAMITPLHKVPQKEVARQTHAIQRNKTREAPDAPACPVPQRVLPRFPGLPIFALACPWKGRYIQPKTADSQKSAGTKGADENNFIIV